MTTNMPVVFIGHGSPLNAIEDNEFSRDWAAVAAEIPRPKSILCISAHWQKAGAFVTAMAAPRSIHDFYGFPDALYQITYPAPGSPLLAGQVKQVVKASRVEPDRAWGLDHGCWSVLHRMYPRADIPVVQVSLNRGQDGAWHYALGQELRALRAEGVLILGSGNIVHNLGMVEWRDTAFDWATRFDALAARLISAGDHAALAGYRGLGRDADLAIPTNEHYLPLLCALGATLPGEPVRFSAARVTLGSISMRSVAIG